MEERSTPLILRPLEVKHLFDFSIRLYRACFTPLFLSMAIVQLPLSLLTLPLVLSMTKVTGEMQTMMNTGKEPDPAWFLDNLDTWVWVGVALLASMVWQLLVMPLGHLAAARLATLALHGERCTLLEALAYARKRYWPTQVVLFTFLLPLLLLSILVLLPVLALTYAGDQGAAAGSAALALFVIMFGALGTLLLFFRFMFAMYGVVQSAEEPDPGGVWAQGMWYLRRSYDLSALYFWRLLGLYFLLAFAIGMVGNGVSQASQLLVGLVRGLAGGNAGQEITNILTQTPDVWTTGIALLLSLLVELIFPALVTCFIVLLYFDLRCRKEGYDLLRMLKPDTLPA